MPSPDWLLSGTRIVFVYSKEADYAEFREFVGSSHGIHRYQKHLFSFSEVPPCVEAFPFTQLEINLRPSWKRHRGGGGGGLKRQKVRHGISGRSLKVQR